MHYWASTQGAHPMRDTIAEQASRYRFFHWHLEFPDIFTVPDGGDPTTPTGWTGGFAWSEIAGVLTVSDEAAFDALDEAALLAARRRRR